ncbi:hypothetical protein PVAND_007541 [Polypedilum vanderplanki]|uniref:Uncharacterized protein n=1 Tax=Polypedilum vanderplanki TaxID=319348 RepID=A0A9J6C841_POLVA|nr:hypothetical protein PVAND_007541 [Polypedilum vanderplanki]
MEETNLSQESITEKVYGLEIKSSESDIQCTSSQIIETIKETVSIECESSSSEESISSDSTTTIEEENVVIEQPQKRKRKRKRKRKKMITTAYEPEEPFTKRYKNFSLDLEMVKKPKLHIKFDDNGNIDEKLSKFNYKPRIIKALEVNLPIHEKTVKRTESCETVQIESHILEESVISLKPRIIKAIGT